MRLRMLMTIATGALALGGAACGGDDKLSMKQLGTKASVICKRYNGKVNAVPKPANIKDAGDTAPYLDAISRVFGEAIGKLKELKPADDVKSDWRAYLAQEDAALKVIDGATTKARAKDASGLQALTKLQAIRTAANTAARKVGATGCAQSPE